MVQSAEPILHCTSSRHTALLSALSSQLSPQLSSKCEGMQLQDQDSVTAMLGSVISALDLLTNARTQHLLLMKSSGRHLERIAISLLSHMAAAQVQCHRACIIKMAQCSSHRACIINMAQCSSHRACSIVVMCTSWQAEVMVAGREEAVDTALSLQPKRAALISETRALQSQVYIYSTAHAELKRERRVRALLLAMCETRALVLELHSKIGPLALEHSSARARTPDPTTRA